MMFRTSIPGQLTRRPRRPVLPSRRRATHDTIMSELTLSSLAQLTVSTGMHDIPSAVSEQAYVGNSKMKGHYVRTLRKVADEADVCAARARCARHDRDRGELVEEQVRGGEQAARVVFNRIGAWLSSTLPIASSTETKEYRVKSGQTETLTTLPPTMHFVLPISAPLQHSSIPRLGNPRAHMS
ncbi:hypothetical protein EDB89DRAFT_1929212 [Lactarius sanguifluus]|nr:hypothetical protein EDB89DRAFT_1929212 [Lactarius sanguifluus]